MTHSQHKKHMKVYVTLAFLGTLCLFTKTEKNQLFFKNIAHQEHHFLYLPFFSVAPFERTPLRIKNQYFSRGCLSNRYTFYIYYFFFIIFCSGETGWDGTDIWHAHAVISALQFGQQFLLFQWLPIFAILGSWTHTHIVFMTFRTCFASMLCANINSLSLYSNCSSYGKRMKKYIHIDSLHHCKKEVKDYNKINHINISRKQENIYLSCGESKPPYSHFTLRSNSSSPCL
jgi:hypothetical protein